MKSQVYKTPLVKTKESDNEESLFQGMLHDVEECAGSVLFIGYFNSNTMVCCRLKEYDSNQRVCNVI
ncbi:hypothetical protein [Parabacteroides sp. FAFU027]|uniref:hypothetical protein n=1 Tax=Parabacteroides sp. FAFU027 TaxID=2922715 RepID=UPI001FAEB799|nr:hypothetical protein [Parabacteroides sp. FAFU027]